MLNNFSGNPAPKSTLILEKALLNNFNKIHTNKNDIKENELFIVTTKRHGHNYPLGTILVFSSNKNNCGTSENSKIRIPISKPTNLVDFLLGINLNIQLLDYGNYLDLDLVRFLTEVRKDSLIEKLHYIINRDYLERMQALKSLSDINPSSQIIIGEELRYVTANAE